MQAMIFAAGIGSRLRPFTLSHPKALAEVAGVPVLQRAVDFLHDRGGAERIVVNVHHFAPQVTKYLATHSQKPQIAVSDESDRLLDTGGGLLAALPLFDKNDDIVVLHNADIVTDFDLPKMLDAFSRTNAAAMLLVSDRTSSRRLWFRNTDCSLCGWENLKTGEFKPSGFRPDDAMTPGAFSGVHVIRLSLIAPLLKEYAAENGPVFSLIPFYLHVMHAAEILSYRQSLPYRWHDIGTPDKLAAANKDFS